MRNKTREIHYRRTLVTRMLVAVVEPQKSALSIKRGSIDPIHGKCSQSTEVIVMHYSVIMLLSYTLFLVG